MISNSRGPETLADLVKEIGHGIKPVTTKEALQAEVIFLAVNFKQGAKRGDRRGSLERKGCHRPY